MKYINSCVFINDDFRFDYLSGEQIIFKCFHFHALERRQVATQLNGISRKIGDKLGTECLKNSLK